MMETVTPLLAEGFTLKKAKRFKINMQNEESDNYQLQLQNKHTNGAFAFYVFIFNYFWTMSLTVQFLTTSGSKKIE